MRSTRPVGGRRDVSFAVGPVTVVVTPRPLEDLGRTGVVDAVVSSDDTMLTMRSGVSRAIRKAAGQQVVEEAARLVPLAIGDVATTSAGTLSAKHVLHAVTVDWENGIAPTERTIRQLSREVFRRCEVLGIRRLGVAALATGMAGFAAHRSARLIVQSLARHVANRTVLETVVFSLPAGDVRAAFLGELQALAGDRLALAARDSAQTRLAPRAAGDDRGSPSRVSAAPAASGRTSLSAALALEGSRPVIGGRYVLLEELGRGGLAVVYLSWDLLLRHVFAVKVLRRDLVALNESLEALQREAAISIGLTHDGIVRCHHFEPRDDTAGPYIVMEYLDWDTGEKWIAGAGERGLPVESVVTVGISLCEGLDYAHASGVLHGDIKPSNVFVDPAGKRGKLADFGLARAMGVVGRSVLLTRLAGTPLYMAPEQQQIGARIGPPTDVYLLAATLWECLTGSFPGPEPAIPSGIDRERKRALSALRDGLRADAGARLQGARALEERLIEAHRRL